MALKFENQCNTDECFCLSKIDRQKMKNHGLQMSVKQLQTLARKSKPYKRIWTGSCYYDDRVRSTNVYRYDDFKNCV